MSIKFTRNDAGFDALRTSAGADALLKAHAVLIAAAANAVPSTTTPAAVGPYYDVHEAGDSHRARYRVATNSIRASLHEAKTHALLRAQSSSG